MRRGRDPDLIGLCGASTFEVAWVRCHLCGAHLEGGHSTSAVTAALLHRHAYHLEGSDLVRRQAALAGRAI